MSPSAPTIAVVHRGLIEDATTLSQFLHRKAGEYENPTGTSPEPDPDPGAVRIIETAKSLSAGWTAAAAAVDEFLDVATDPDISLADPVTQLLLQQMLFDHLTTIIDVQDTVFRRISSAALIELSTRLRATPTR